MSASEELRPRGPGAAIAWGTKRLRRLFPASLRRAVERALDIGPSAGGARERLSVHRVSGHLRIEWQARGLHPWDADLPGGRRAVLLAEQAIDDTDRALTQLFQRMPEVEAVTVQVFDPECTDTVVLAGTVHRADLTATDPGLSTRMRLKLMGIHFQMADNTLQPL